MTSSCKLHVLAKYLQCDDTRKTESLCLIKVFIIESHAEVLSYTYFIHLQLAGCRLTEIVHVLFQSLPLHRFTKFNKTCKINANKRCD